jgi:hypothetical protein
MADEIPEAENESIREEVQSVFCNWMSLQKREASVLVPITVIEICLGIDTRLSR